MPDFIMNAPELPDCDGLLFTAFVDLDTCRQDSFGGGGSIPFTSIVQYGQFIGLDGEDLHEFISIMTLTDNLVLKKIAEDKK